MIRLSKQKLVAALRFVQGLHGIVSLDSLRVAVPAGLSRLIAADRVSFNEIFALHNGRDIEPHPVPPWWRRLGALYRAHLHEHLIWRPRFFHHEHELMAFSDYAGDWRWQQSTLFNDYFLALGVRYQIGTLSRIAEPVRFGIAFNRDRRDFSPQDRDLLRLLSPHLGHAIDTSLAYAAALRSVDRPEGNRAAASHILVLAPDARTILRFTPGAPEFLAAFFPGEASAARYLPDVLARWLRLQRDWSRAREPTGEPPPKFADRRRGCLINARLASAGPDELILLVSGRGKVLGEAAAGLAADLTAREREILRWASEGKRDAEIGMILGISPRTVSKHLENSFRKLGVETRTAAIREWEAGGPHSHA